MASSAALVFSVFLLAFSVTNNNNNTGLVVRAQQRNQSSSANLINLDSWLSPTTPPTSWPSPSDRFEFGFYRQGDGFAVGVWLVGNPQNTIVWTANRDDPPVSSNARLHLSKEGKLVVKREEAASKEDELIVVDSLPASYASMLDSGEFVLRNSSHHVIWSSFDYPTDTILSGQSLSLGDSLVSGASNTDHSTGRFHLVLQNDGNLVGYPLNTSYDKTNCYWASNTPTDTHDGSLYLDLTERGILWLRNATVIFNTLTFANASNSGNNKNNNKTVIYRATLDPDGIFRLYSHGFNSNRRSIMSIEWSALQDPCDVKGMCGLNSLCTLVGTDPQCLCFPGFDFVNPNQTLRGCYRSFPDQICVGVDDEQANMATSSTLYNITTMENIVWGDRPYFVALMKKEDCGESCLKDCNCGAALYYPQGSSTYCAKLKLPLRYARTYYEASTTAIFKVSTSGKSFHGINEATAPAALRHPIINTQNNKNLLRILVISLGSVTFSCIVIAILSFFVYRNQLLMYTRLSGINQNSSDLTEDVTLRNFSYEELEKATQGFKEELGGGSTGTVYKGALSDQENKIVAVKRLEKVVGAGEKEFRAEMNAIGRTHHKNLVRLLGFCAENSRRLLVYEYMSNGSLADLLFKSERRPLWKERMRIALDVARGILYLHEECETNIIHCDIKPQNILMDDFWTAKISDFGLAKLLVPYQTRTFTGVRGTRGYLAPEWHKNNAPISVKADVYSFGIVMLEIVCCRRNLEIDVATADEIILSTWVYNCFDAGDLRKLVGDEEEVDLKTLERMVKVGLWCIQEEPALRPSTKNVILMLEGIIMDISIPPCPIL